MNNDRQQRMKREMLEYLRGERDWIYGFIAAGDMEVLGRTMGSEFVRATAQEWKQVIDQLVSSREIDFKGGEIRFKRIEPLREHGQKQLQLFKE